VSELMQLEPTLTIAGWRERSPSNGFITGEVWGEVMRKAGVPA